MGNCVHFSTYQSEVRVVACSGPGKSIKMPLAKLLHSLARKKARREEIGRNIMPKRSAFASIFLTTTILSVACPAMSAEVTADRLTNADKEPQNWLMNHRTYDAQRY